MTAATHLRQRFEPLLNGRLARFMRKPTLAAVGAIVLVALWQLSAVVIDLPITVYPTPMSVVAEFALIYSNGILVEYTLDSASRYLSGVVIGTAIGLGAGLVLGLTPFLYRMFQPIINFFYSIVDAAWIPIFVIWFGYGEKVILIMLVYTVSFPIAFNVITGIKIIPAVLINANLSLGASRLQILANVIIPSILPNTFAGFRVGAGFAFRSLVIAEIIAGSSGIGYMIFDGAANQMPSRTVCGMIVLGLLWLYVEQVFLNPLERVTVDRWGPMREGDSP